MSDAVSLHPFYTAYTASIVSLEALCTLLFLYRIVVDLGESTDIARHIATTFRSRASSTPSKLLSTAGTGSSSALSSTDSTSISKEKGDADKKHGRNRSGSNVSTMSNSDKQSRCQRITTFFAWPRLKRFLAFGHIALQTVLNIDFYGAFGRYDTFTRVMLWWVSMAMLACIFGGQMYWSVKISFAMQFMRSEQGAKMRQHLAAGTVAWVVGISAFYFLYLWAPTRMVQLISPLGLTFFIVVLAVFSVATWFHLRAHLRLDVAATNRENLTRLLRRWAMFSILAVFVSAALLVVIVFHVVRALDQLDLPNQDFVSYYAHDYTQVPIYWIDIALNYLLLVVSYVLLILSWRAARRAKRKTAAEAAASAAAASVRRSRAGSARHAHARSPTSSVHMARGRGHSLPLRVSGNYDTAHRSIFSEATTRLSTFTAMRTGESELGYVASAIGPARVATEGAVCAETGAKHGPLYDTETRPTYVHAEIKSETDAPAAFSDDDDEEVVIDVEDSLCVREHTAFDETTIVANREDVKELESGVGGHDEAAPHEEEERSRWEHSGTPPDERRSNRGSSISREDVGPEERSKRETPISCEIELEELNSSEQKTSVDVRMVEEASLESSLPPSGPHEEEQERSKKEDSESVRISNEDSKGDPSGHLV